MRQYLITKYTAQGEPAVHFLLNTQDDLDAAPFTDPAILWAVLQQCPYPGKPTKEAKQEAFGVTLLHVAAHDPHILVTGGSGTPPRLKRRITDKERMDWIDDSWITIDGTGKAGATGEWQIIESAPADIGIGKCLAVGANLRLSLDHALTYTRMKHQELLDGTGKTEFSDEQDYVDLVNTVMLEHPEDPLMTELLARAMTLAKGQTNPSKLRELFAEALSKRQAARAAQSKAAPPDFSIPATVIAGVQMLIDQVSPEDREYIKTEPPEATHFTSGMAMRNSWGLWRDSPIRRDAIEKYGISHADDISSLIRAWAWSIIRGEDFDPEGYCERFRKHWAEYGQTPLEAGGYKVFKVGERVKIRKGRDEYEPMWTATILGFSLAGNRYVYSVQGAQGPDDTVEYEDLVKLEDADA